MRDKLSVLSSLVGEEIGRWLLADYGGRLSALVLQVAEPGSDYSHPGLEKIEAARELVQLALLEELSERAVLSSPGQVREYLRLTLEGRGYEVFMVLFLDAQNRLVAAEEMFRGSLSQTSVYPREVVKAGLAHNAAGVILAHNHPAGLPNRAGRTSASRSSSRTRWHWSTSRCWITSSSAADRGRFCPLPNEGSCSPIRGVWVSLSHSPPRRGGFLLATASSGQ